MSEDITALLQQYDRAQAVIHLTRRDDLRIEDTDVLPAPALLVSVLRNGEETGCLFGVLVSSGTYVPSSKNTESTISKMTHVPFPVCNINVVPGLGDDDDMVTYTWLLEPRVDEDGMAMLSVNRDVLDGKKGAPMHPLTREALDDLVAQVTRWYDARPARRAA